MFYFAICFAIYIAIYFAILRALSIDYAMLSRYAMRRHSREILT